MDELNQFNKIACSLDRKSEFRCSQNRKPNPIFWWIILSDSLSCFQSLEMDYKLAIVNHWGFDEASTKLLHI